MSKSTREPSLTHKLPIAADIPEKNQLKKLFVPVRSGTNIKEPRLYLLGVERYLLVAVVSHAYEPVLIVAFGKENVSECLMAECNGVTYKVEGAVWEVIHVSRDMCRHKANVVSWIEIKAHPSLGSKYAKITNGHSGGWVYLRYGMDGVVNLAPGDSVWYNFDLGLWQVSLYKINPCVVCTCGVKFSGGLCSDWCDLVRTA